MVVAAFAIAAGTKELRTNFLIVAVVHPNAWQQWYINPVTSWAIEYPMAHASGTVPGIKPSCTPFPTPNTHRNLHTNCHQLLFKCRTLHSNCSSSFVHFLSGLKIHIHPIIKICNVMQSDDTRAQVERPMVCKDSIIGVSHANSILFDGRYSPEGILTKVFLQFCGVMPFTKEI